MAKKDKKAGERTAKAQGASEGGIRLSGHPRARRDIATAKGWGGIGAFVLVLLLSLRAGVPTSDAVLRAIAGGVVGYVVAWGMAVSVWRHLALAEVEQAKQRLMAAAPEDEPDAARPAA